MAKTVSCMVRGCPSKAKDEGMEEYLCVNCMTRYVSPDTVQEFENYAAANNHEMADLAWEMIKLEVKGK